MKTSNLNNTSSIPEGTPSISIDQIIGLTSDLANVLAQETLLLRQMKITEVNTLQERKLRLVHKLETLKKLIKQFPQLLENASPKELATLNQVNATFKQTIDENYVEVWKAQEINRQVMDYFMAAAKDHMRHQSQYNNQGDFAYGTQRELPPVTLNEAH